MGPTGKRTIDKFHFFTKSALPRGKTTWTLHKITMQDGDIVNEKSVRGLTDTVRAGREAEKAGFRGAASGDVNAFDAANYNRIMSNEF